MSQRTPADPTLIYSKIVERYAHLFDRPEIRLRFLNNTLARQAANREKLEQILRRHPFIRQTPLYHRFLELSLYRLIFLEIEKHLPTASDARHKLFSRGQVPTMARVIFGCYQFRRPLYGLGVVLMIVTLFGLYSGINWSARRVNDYMAQRYRATQGPQSNAGNPYTAMANDGTKHLPDYRPEKVWLVESKDNYERYSNGGRIMTLYETGNHARAFYVLQRGGSRTAEKQVRHEPVGIVYHTSESDLVSFTPDNSDSIENHTRGLLEYVKKNRSYNYLIDRFGQVYRIVRDGDAANHSGNSIWADVQGVYVGLNESFLGVCFETNSKADSLEEQLTEAQIIAGRLLTQILRSRHQIDDANCVTHGLVSVNPNNMLICYHYDWARNFPFEAMGLSDKYKVAPATISEFGFTYDDEIVNKLGGAVWPGARMAEEEFRRRATQSGESLNEIRRRLRDRYREEMNLQRRLRSSTSSDEPGIGFNLPASTTAFTPQTARPS